MRDILLPQNVANAVDIAGDDGERNVAFKTIDAMIRAFVQAMNFQCVDSRFYCRVRAAGMDKRFGVGFKNREYFFLMGNHFAFEHTARDLANLTSSMLAIIFDFKLQEPLGGGSGNQSTQGGLNLVQVPLCLFDIGSMGLNSLPLGFRRLAPFSVLYLAQ